MGDTYDTYGADDPYDLMFCNHANENPNVCPCGWGCNCRRGMCKMKKLRKDEQHDGIPLPTTQPKLRNPQADPSPKMKVSFIQPMTVVHIEGLPYYLLDPTRVAAAYEAPADVSL